MCCFLMHKETTYFYDSCVLLRISVEKEKLKFEFGIILVTLIEQETKCLERTVNLLLYNMIYFFK